MSFLDSPQYARGIDGSTPAKTNATMSGFSRFDDDGGAVDDGAMAQQLQQRRVSSKRYCLKELWDASPPVSGCVICILLPTRISKCGLLEHFSVGMIYYGDDSAGEPRK